MPSISVGRNGMGRGRTMWIDFVEALMLMAACGYGVLQLVW